jgi:hypothetical protein
MMGYRLNNHLPFRDTGICSICGKPRSPKGHKKCSKKRQAQYAALNGKSEVRP